MFDGCGDKGYGPARKGASGSVAIYGQFALGFAEPRRIEEIIVQDAAIHAEGAKHAMQLSAQIL